MRPLPKEAGVVVGLPTIAASGATVGGAVVIVALPTDGMSVAKQHFKNV